MIKYWLYCTIPRAFVLVEGLYYMLLLFWLLSRRLGVFNLRQQGLH